jgi:hypothetical protein
LRSKPASRGEYAGFSVGLERMYSIRYCLHFNDIKLDMDLSHITVHEKFSFTEAYKIFKVL